MPYQSRSAMTGTTHDEGGAMASRLVEVQSLIEDRFLAAGDVLCHAVDGIGTLIAGLDQLIEAMDLTTIAATTADLNLAAAKLTALPGAQSKRRTVIEFLLDQRETLVGKIAEMRRSLSYMRAFSINIKITASGISTSDAEFGLVAHDISQCIEAGGQEILGLEADTSALTTELQKALADGAVLDERCHELIPAIPNELGASSVVIDRHYHEVAAAAEAAGNVARDVRSKVGRVLGALQIGDSTSQRVDHAQATLGILARYQAGLSPRQCDRLGEFIHTLLSAQLTATVDDFTHNVAEIETSMAALIGNLSDLLRLRDAAYGRAAGEKDGFLRALSRQIEVALALVIEIEAADRVAADTGTLVAAAANNLAARVTSIQAIKTDVSFMAINTTLSSNRVGEIGRPLRVVAVELSQHGGHLESSAAECIGVLDKVVRSATELAGGAAREGGSQPDTEAAAKALSAASARIRSAGDRTETGIAVLANQGEALLGSLGQFSNHFDLSKDIEEPLRAAATRLAALGLASMAATDDISEPLRALLTELGNLYTMEQERAVHAQMTKSWGIGPLVSRPLATI